MTTLLCLLAMAGMPNLDYWVSPSIEPTYAVALDKPLQAGWNEFARIAGFKGKAPTIRRTSYEQASVYLWASDHMTSAEVRTNWSRTSIHLHLFAPKLRARTDTERAHVVTHELLHAFYELPDHHRVFYAGDHPECVMDNFFINGWTGRLCTGCRAKIGRQQGQQ